MLLFLFCGCITAAAGSNGTSPAEVRLLFVVSSYASDAIELRPLELAAAHLEERWATAAASSTPRQVRVRLLNAGDVVGRAAMKVLEAIDQFGPCVLIGATSRNPEVTYTLAHIAMTKNLLVIPWNDISARTVLDGSSFGLSVNAQGIILGAATFLDPFFHFMRHFGWKRAIVLLDVSAGVLATELFKKAASEVLDIRFVFMSLEGGNYRQEIARVLDIIDSYHYSIIGVSLLQPGDDRVQYFQRAISEKGLDVKGYQWCVMSSPSSLGDIMTHPEMFYLYPSVYEPETDDPEAWSTGLAKPYFASLPAILVSLYGMKRPMRLICDTVEDCVSNFNMISLVGGGVRALYSYVSVYVAGSIASYLLDRGLCGLLNASAEVLLQAALDQEIRPPLDLGAVSFEAVPGGLSRATTVHVCLNETYAAYSHDSSYKDLVGVRLRRSVAVISRQGDVHLLDGWTGVPASEFPKVFGRPFSFMGNTTNVPRDFVPDSCGPEAAVNGSRCSRCAYGTLLPMNGTNRCLPAAMPCLTGQVWNFEKVQCEDCRPGRFSSKDGCLACPQGRTSNAKDSSCPVCVEGYYMPPGTDKCLFCTGRNHRPFLPYVAYADKCVVEFFWPVFMTLLCVLGILTATIFTKFRFNLHQPWIAGRFIRIEDISIKKNSLVVTVCGSHNLMRRHWQPLHIRFQNTACTELDDPKAKYQGRVISNDRIVICAERDQVFSENFEAAQGTICVSAWQAVLFTNMLLVLFALECVAALAAAWFLSSCERIVAIVASFIAGAVVGRQARHHKQMTNLDRQVYNYRKEHVRQPIRVPQGPSRAIAAGRLSEFHESFQTTIKNRNMYFVCPNIMMQLTAPFRCSFAELIGPSQVDFFISHWWGEEFAYTVASVKAHASHPSVCDDKDWQSLTYWFCTFSNNQYAVEDELGSDIYHSAFAITLRSGFCKGTCLILREHAEPLKRSWCLFEFIQTMELQESGSLPNFGGLFFCTGSGVLNFGAASVELSLQIGAKLAELRLEDAQASVAKDKRLIDAAVQQHMGGFEPTNARLRTHIGDALHVAKAFSDSKFTSVFDALSMRTVPEKVEDITFSV